MTKYEAGITVSNVIFDLPLMFLSRLELLSENTSSMYTKVKLNPS